MNHRVSWHDLPSTLRHHIEADTGTFIGEKPVTAGRNCLIGMILDAAGGRYLLKGVSVEHAWAVWTQSNEAAINHHVQAVTARLVFHTQADGWDVLGFEHLDAHHHADLSPDSPDLDKIADTLHALSTVPAPHTVRLRTIVDRWSEYVGDRSSMLGGSTIAHTDLHRHNILIGDQAKLVDWAWPTLAAPWFDTACVGLQLIVGGHHPSDAERWCETEPRYAGASDEAVSTFVDAAHLMWREIRTNDPQPWKQDVAAAALAWARFRDVRR